MTDDRLAIPKINDCRPGLRKQAVLQPTAVGVPNRIEDRHSCLSLGAPTPPRIDAPNNVSRTTKTFRCSGRVFGLMVREFPLVPSDRQECLSSTKTNARPQLKQRCPSL